MLGVYDFMGHYDWTFEWLRQRGGDAAVEDYWVAAISHDSQAHARAAFSRGFEGMQDYWGHTLADEGAGYTSALHDVGGRPVMRIDMQDCPSKGFLLRNGIGFYDDYCTHCMGWIGPALADAGFVADHEHDHAAHCWWEIRPADDATLPTSPGQVPDDVRLLPIWDVTQVHRFRRSAPEGKTEPS